MRKYFLLITPIFLLLTGFFLVSQPTSATNQANITADINASPEISGRLFYKGLDSPLDIDFTGITGDDRVFVTSKSGAIRINGENYNTPFLSLEDEVGGENEKGMLGMVFDPDFATNRYFYVFYTGMNDEEGNFTSYIERFTVSDDPNFADKSSRQILLQLDQKTPYHNGGNLAFGPDGYLYIGIGDDSQVATQDNGLKPPQDLNRLIGKILRIDVDPSTVGNQPADCDTVSGNYSIPSDNPFVGQDACKEVWAYGLRNPWRFTFDSLTGDIYIGDVGQDKTEELDFQLASSLGGENYGWPFFEGNGCAIRVDDDPKIAISQADCDALANHTPPIYDYPHSETGGSITGGYVYRGSNLPNLVGHYVFGDFTNSQLLTAYNDNGTWNVTDHGPMVESPLAFLSAFGVDSSEELYAIRFTGEPRDDEAGVTGAIYRITDGYGFDITLEAPATVDPGSDIEYTVMVTNVGTITATNIHIENDVPAGSNYVSGGTLSSSTVSLTVPILGPNESASMTWVTTPLTSTVTNSNYRVSAGSSPVITGTKPVTTVVQSGIIGRVFEDLNKDGIDNAEPGIAGANVVLWKNEACDGAVETSGVNPPDYIATKVSISDGSFRFDVPDDSICYLIQIDRATLPDNIQTISPQNAGDNDSIDSDIDVTNGWTAYFRVPTPAVNAGFYDPDKTVPIFLPVIVR